MLNYAEALPSSGMILMTPEPKLFHSYAMLVKLAIFTQTMQAGFYHILHAV